MMRDTDSITETKRTRSLTVGVRGAAFTIVELMVVVAVVGVLVGILLVAFGGVRRSAQQALATRLLATIGQAVEAFEREVGYLPPLLVYDQTTPVLLGNQPQINVFEPSLVVPEAKHADNFGALRTELEATRFGSEFTLPAYLLGTGDINNSEMAGQTVGGNNDKDDGQAGPGFRDPGPDRSWGDAHERDSADIAADATTKIGRVYGPYLDPAGLAEHLRLDKRTGMFKMTDSWDQPIRYYKGWRTKNDPLPGAPAEPGVDFVPVELRTADAVEYQADDLLQRADLQLERPVFGAKFMILSAGVPIFEGRDGHPIPLFGDRDRGDPPAMEFIDDLPLIHSLALPFTPGTLPTSPSGGGTRDLMLEDLKSNLRYIP